MTFKYNPKRHVKRKNKQGTTYFINRKTEEIVAKECGVCGTYKSLTEFNVLKSGLGGKESKCKPCRKDYDRQRYREKPEYWKEWRKENIKKYRKYQADYRVGERGNA